MITILASAVIVLAEFGTFGNAQGQGKQTQGNVTAGNVTLTRQQKELNPVNTTESKICGIPITLKPSTSNATMSSTNTTTGAQALPSSPPTPPATSIAPSATPH